jgi:hypothetical protein
MLAGSSTASDETKAALTPSRSSLPKPSNMIRQAGNSSCSAIAIISRL